MEFAAKKSILKNGRSKEIEKNYKYKRNTKPYTRNCLMNNLSIKNFVANKINLKNYSQLAQQAY